MKKAGEAIAFMFLSILLVACRGNKSEDPEEPFLTITESKITADESGKYKFSFQTNKGATYSVYDDDLDQQILKKKTSTGSVSVSLEGEGKVTVTSSIDGRSIKKTITLLSSLSAESTAKQDIEETNPSHGLDDEAAIFIRNREYYGLTFESVTKKFDAHGESLIESDDTEIAISNEKSVQFTVNYSNKGDAEAWLPSIYDFAVYDPSGHAGEIISQQEGQTEVSEGHSGSTTFWVNFSSPTPAGTELEVEYQPEEIDYPVKFNLIVR